MRKSFSFFLVLMSLSACSEVSLNYQGANRLQQLGLASPTLNAGGVKEALATLRLDTQVDMDFAQLAGLNLHFTLRNASGVLKTLSISAEKFFSEKALFWQELPLGDAFLSVELLNAQGDSVGRVEHTLMLQPESEDAVLFRLTEANPAQGALTVSQAGQAFESLAFTIASPTDQTQTPNSGSATNQPSSHVPLVQGSNSDLLELKLRLVESGQTSLQFVWEPPPNVEVAYYQLLLDGKVVAEQHTSTNYRANNLLQDTEYTFTVVPVLVDGSVLPEVPLAGTTGQGSSSGGGGGGGGGGGSSSGGSGSGSSGSSGGSGNSGGTVNNPPVIQSLTPSKTTVNGLGYPVQLTATATDDQTLTDASYTWSCNACGDASFDKTHSSQVVWNAPTTPGDYTIKLSVSDGVNPPVTTTQVITVKHQTATVTVIGNYK